MVLEEKKLTVTPLIFVTLLDLHSHLYLAGGNAKVCLVISDEHAATKFAQFASAATPVAAHNTITAKRQITKQ